EQVEAVRAQGFVTAVEPYSLAETLSPELVQLLEEAERSPSPDPVTFDLMVHAPEQVEAVARMIQGSGQGEVESASGRCVRFRAPVLSPLVAALAERTEVKWITPYEAPELFCDFGRSLIGIAAAEQSPGGPWDGTGEVVGLLDSGADQGHPDLQGRIRNYQTVPGATPQDRAGHGTHVAGILCGTGAGSNGKVRGVAPGAELAVVGIVNAQNTPLLPADMGSLLDLAVRQGAKIINLSLGLSKNRYDQYAESIDQFVLDNPGVLVVVAAGNSGTAKQGFPDFNTLGTPAAAKNVITVGACLSDRAGFTTTWSQYNSGAFAGAPVGPGLLTGPPIISAALSSRGPTDYDSFKPDVVAPGTYILSAQASGATMKSFAPVPPGTGRYMYLNGTSMAAPFVSGAAAVLRHYLRKEMSVSEPSAALLKALLCASAERGPSVMSAAVEPRVGYPDFDQGLGLVSLAALLPRQDAQGLRLSFVDVANGSAEALQSRVPPGSARRANRLYKVTVAAGGSPLRVVLVWTDAPGRYVQNTLQLDVRGPNVHLIGNHEHTYKQDPLFQDMGLPGVPFDRKNNVQVVSLKSAAAGEYTINVLADNTPDPNHFQGYALVVLGRLAGAVSEEAPAF
ncbi:MAG: S8 family serine peptidase, partial [Thermoanaerobaculia bacterium]